MKSWACITTSALALMAMACDESTKSSGPSSSTNQSSAVSSSSLESLSSQGASSTALSSSALVPTNPEGFPKVVLALPVDSSAWIPQAQTRLSFANWMEFRKGAWSLTFDDGFKSHVQDVAPLLEKYGFRGTFFVTLDALVDRIAEEGPRTGSWEGFIGISQKGHEVGAHSLDHSDLTTLDATGLDYQLDTAAARLKSRIPQNRLVTMATPYTANSAAVRSQMTKSYLANRDVGGAGVVSPLNLLRLGASVLTFETIRTPEGDQAKMDALQKSIENSVIQTGRWSTYLAHEVIPQDSIASSKGYYPVALESFEKHLAWLQQKSDAKELWVAPMGTVARYVVQKFLARGGVLQEDDQQVRLVVDDGLDDQDYPLPLSVEIALPSSWKAAKVLLQQGSVTQEYSVEAGKIKAQVLANGVEIRLSPL
jgi:peptidoglycan/xylan/chitin deacetylase (PgdA/CDA1 family)